VSLNNHLVLLVGPPLLADIGVEVVVPSLPALLAYPSGQLFGDGAPIFGTTAPHQL